MNRFTINKELGRGGFGTAQLVTRRNDGKQFVIKQVDAHGMSEEQKRGSNNEVKILASLEDPHIVRYMESWHEDSKLNILMEYCTDGTVADLIAKQKGRPLATPKTLEIFWQISRGLKYCHDRNIMHRDVKPDNCFLTMGGAIVKLGDFGISKILEHTSASVHTKNTPGFPAYQAQEMFTGDSYTNKVDVWSAGCILFELAHGKRLFDLRVKQPIMPQIYWMRMMNKVIEHDHEPISEECPVDIGQLIKDCINQEPSKRPRAVDMLNRAFEMKIKADQAKVEKEMSKMSMHETLPPVPQRTTPTSFNHQQLTKMKHNIYAVVRKGITVVNDHEVIIIDGDQDWTAGKCVMVNTKTRKVTPITPPDSFIVSVAILDAGFVTASKNGTILKWNEKCNIVKQIKPTSKNTMIKLINNEVVAVTENGPLIIFDQQLNQVKTFTGSRTKGLFQNFAATLTGNGRPTCLDGNDKYIAFGDYGGRVRFYARHGPSEPTIYQHDDVTAVSVAGDLVASSSWDKTVKIWSMSEVKQVAQMKHDKVVKCVVLHNDMAITASVDKTVRVWETRTGKLMHTLTHSTYCTNVDISPDKTIMAVAHYDDGGVQFWCMKKWTKLGAVKLGDTMDVRFLNDCELIAGNYNGEVNMISMN